MGIQETLVQKLLLQRVDLEVRLVVRTVVSPPVKVESMKLWRRRRPAVLARRPYELQVLVHYGLT